MSVITENKNPLYCARINQSNLIVTRSTNVNYDSRVVPSIQISFWYWPKTSVCFRQKGLTCSEPSGPVLLVEALGSLIRQIVVAFSNERSANDNLPSRSCNEYYHETLGTPNVAFFKYRTNTTSFYLFFILFSIKWQI